MRVNSAYSSVLGYGIAVLSVAAATWLTRVLSGLGDVGISPQFFAAVLVSAWFGGLGPGLAATALSGLASGYLLVMAHSSSLVAIREDVLRVAVFSVVAVLASSLHAATRRAAVEADRARRAAESASAAKSRFLAMVSHELRTPLGPIVMISEMLADDPTLSERVRRDMQNVRRHVGLEIRLIEDLLDLTRISSGKLRLHLEPIDPHQPLAAAIGVCEADLKAKGLKLETEFGAEEARVMGDAVRLEQVFWNLIRNAIKFSAEGGRVVVRTGRGSGEDEKPGARSREPEEVRGCVGGACVSEGASAPAHSGAHALTHPSTQHSALSTQHSSQSSVLSPQSSLLLVEVTDTGIGIDPERLSAIFNAFEQADEDVSVRFGGLGLGLAICQALVQAHGGSIRASSAGKGTGATFTVMLPLVEQTASGDRPPTVLATDPEQNRAEAGR